MLKYGNDKPDLRAQLELVDITDVFEGSEFKAFAGKHVRALPVPDIAGAAAQVLRPARRVRGRAGRQGPGLGARRPRTAR